MTGTPVPLISKTQLVSVGGTTAMWTPGGSRRFQLMGWQFMPLPTLTATGNCYVNWRDGGTLFAKAGTFGTAAPSVPFNLSVTLPGDGYISNTDGGTLNLDIDAVILTGSIAVTVWGYEI